jgi:hypothetical protein
VATRERSSVDVQECDDFDRMLDDLPRWRGMTIAIDIATDAEALNSAAEYDELALLAQTYDVEVSISTDDPLRQELARIYGLTITSTPDRATTSILRSLDLQTTRVRSPFVSRRYDAPTTRGPQPADTDWPSSVSAGSLLAPRGGAVLDPDASFSFVVAPPGERYPRFDEALDGRTGVPGTSVAQRAERRAKHQRDALNASALVVAVVVIAIAVAVLIIGLLAPSAHVVLIPETRVIASEVSYAIAPSGAQFDVVLEPRLISETIQTEMTAPATGQREIPDTGAQGMVFLTNPLTQAVTIPAGTVIVSLDGEQEFLTTAEISVPAADPFGAATFGTAVVDVSAIAPGPDGNLATGELAGELPSGVLYQNRFPLDGGTLKVETFVTSDDLAGLAARAEAELQGGVDTALLGEIEPGWQLFDNPHATDLLSASYSAAAGDVVEEVSIVAELRVEASVFNPDDLHHAATVELERRLGSMTPEGFGLVLDSMQTSAPQPIDSESGFAFTMSSQATIEAYIDPALEASLPEDLTGKSEASAARILDDIGGLASYRLSYGPDWLPWEPVPRFANRISVDIDAS